jgi:hypothetical protein
MRLARSAVAWLALLATPTGALAQDPSAILDAPAPPTLPSLAHATLNNTFEITGAGIDVGPRRGAATAYFLHDEAEYPLISRVFFVGAAHDVAFGAVRGVGKEAFVGSPEIWARGLWSSVLGFSSGGGLGVVLPVPHALEGDAREIFDAIRVVRPWDASHFTDMTVTLRPWIDVRYVRGRFLLQLRQGLDVGVVARRLAKGERRTDYTARTTFYLGFRLAKPIGLGVEVWEVYQISADLPDDKRAAFSVSPSVRLSLGRIEPAFSVLFPIATPLRGEAASYFAARVNVGFDFDAGRREK